MATFSLVDRDTVDVPKNAAVMVYINGTGSFIHVQAAQSSGRRGTVNIELRKQPHSLSFYLQPEFARALAAELLVAADDTEVEK